MSSLPSNGRTYSPANPNYTETWAAVAHSFEEALCAKDIDTADRIWSNHAERFLWRNASPLEQFPAHMPPRGAVLPKEDIPVCNKYCHVSQMARNSFNDKTDKMLGLAHDIRNRVRRLLFHANKAPAWRGSHFQVLNRHLPDPEITSIIIDLKNSSAVLANGSSRIQTR